jgi:hypothetical protein
MDWEMMIPILAIALSIGGPVAIVIVAMVHSHRKDLAVNRMVGEAVASGRSPEEIRQIIASVKGSDGVPRKRNALRTALILIGLGLGMCTVGPITGNMQAFIGAGIVFFLGLAFLAIWFLIEKPKSAA